MVFRVNLEAPVVSKSLVKISDDLGGFERSSWLVSSYLLGYVGKVIFFQHLKSNSLKRTVESTYCSICLSL